LCFPIVYGSPLQPPAQPSSPDVGIFYEGADLTLAEGYLGAHDIKNLLGHFGLCGELVRVTEYQFEQLSHYRAVFYIGSITKTMLPDAFLNDLRSPGMAICWLGQHLDQLLADSKFQAHFGLRYVGFKGNRTAWRVDYKDTLSGKGDSETSSITSLGSSSALATEVIAVFLPTELIEVVNRRRGPKLQGDGSFVTSQRSRWCTLESRLLYEPLYKA
jgi:uncharacterized protein YdaL